ncbi:MAG: hypothetical protein GTO46_03425, partial [Gemmatimonadetes bacterium]|nr:hypothetical protein [Gemmatimonadota bacterium]NIO30820.1 hypothetical protein [Gemmatimonadota bacterium]
MPKGSSGDDGEDRAPAGDALQEPAGVARQENPLERQARELASKGYSQYTIALLMGTRPTEVSSLLGVIQPSGKGSARKRERPEQAARPVVPIESIVHEPR